MKKRLIVYPLIIALLISLIGCGEKQNESDPVSTKEEKSNKKEEKEPEVDVTELEVTESDLEEPEAKEGKPESDKAPESVDISVCARIYYDYLSTDRSDIDFNYNDYDYSFIYLDNDDIPEIYFSGDLATGSGLFYIGQGEVKKEWTSGDGE